MGMVAGIASGQEVVGGQGQKPAAVKTVLSTEAVESQRKLAEKNSDLDAGLRTKLLEIYDKTLEQLRAADASALRSEQLRKSVQSAPNQLEQLKTELADPPRDAPPEVPSEATLAQLLQLQSQAETQLAEAQSELATLQAEPARRTDRRAEVPKLADAAKAQLEELDRQLAAKPAPEEDARVTEAARALLLARKKAIEAEQAANVQELNFYEATGELLSAQRDLAARRVADLEKLVKAWRGIVGERRRRDVERQTLEAQRAAADAHPAVREIADVNAQLAKLRLQVASQIEQAARDLETVDQLATRVEDQFKKVRARIETAGATEAIGLLLRARRDELPNVSSFSRRMDARTEKIATIQLELIDHEDARAALADLERRVNGVLEQIDGNIPPDERADIEAKVRQLLEMQRSFLDALIRDTTSYLDKLVELDVRERQLINQVAEYAEYCDERILWIRSSSFPRWSDVSQLRQALVWLTSQSGWHQVGTYMVDDARRVPLPVVAICCALPLLVFGRRLFRRTMREAVADAAKGRGASMLPILRALLLTLVLALTWPAVMAYVGYRLSIDELGSEFAGAIGHGLQATALVLATVELFRQICRPGGLGEGLFGWPVATMKLVRSTLWLFITFGLPCVFVVSVCEAQSSEAIKNSLGRFAFLVALAILAFCGHRLMHPSGGVLYGIYANSPEGWVRRLRRVWYVTTLSIPAILATLAIVGYYYTALELTWRMLASLWLILSLIVIRAVVLHWVLVAYRDLAMKRVRERQALSEAKASGPAKVLAQTGATVSDSALEVRLSDVNRQTRNILSLLFAAGAFLGLWLVWVDVLPALGALRRIDLWFVSVAGADGAMTTKPVTLANLVLAVFAAVVTLIASKNVPGLLEITVLQRLPLDPGGRYAISTLSKYAISVVGLVLAFGAVGIGWSKVQWLVAALGVGLGFGLQEIFANFVSGLILLFERPVRVGDIVTVGDVTGTVSRIRMRATTILDWDMRELVVPNKDFITGRVMNWTLSSKVSRMTINVGVAYGTDPDQVRELLLQVARENDMVLREPPPHALFDGFGDSTLMFVLRVYMSTRDVFLQLRHDLLTAIFRSFQEAGIEIAFPQRDIHIRTAPQMQDFAHGPPRRSEPENGHHSPESSAHVDADGE
jgi:potassium efflux system protein